MKKTDLIIENHKEIWEFISKNCLRKKFCWHEFIVIPKNKFKEVQGLFEKHKNLFFKEVEYRSKHFLRHVHAIDFGDVVICHRDFVNHKKTKLIGLILHTILDFIPYIFMSFLKLKKPIRYF